MRVSFRQGVVRAPAGFLVVGAGTVTLTIPPNDSFIATIADGNSNYLVSERLTVTNAWTGITTGVDRWIYIDLNTSTGARTFGSTTVAPVSGATAPVGAADKHWFDTANTVMKVWNGARWVRKVRVFVAKIQGGTVPVSVSANAPAFTGTQVGNTTKVSAGDLIFDDDDRAIKKGSGQFFTTEDSGVTTAASASRVKFASQIIQATADSTLLAYSVVKFSDFNKVVQSASFVALDGIYGFVESDAVVGDTVNVVVDGVITNPSWDWTSAGVNAFLYVNGSGFLTATPVSSTEPIAIVIDKTSILLRPASLFGLQADVVTGGNALTTQNEGVTLSSTTAVMNFVGGGVNATNSGDNITVTIPAGITFLDELSDVNTTTLVTGQVLSFNGAEWVNITPVTNLDSITDVTLTSPTSGQALTFNGTNWVNTTPVTPATNLDGLTDVTISTPSNGQVLSYNGSQWVNAAASSNLDALTDVTLTAPSNGQVLSYNGSQWVNVTSGAGITNLDGLSDVTLTSPSGGQALIYDGAQWVNTTLVIPANNLDGLTDVVLTTPSNGQALTYNGTNWVNTTPVTSFDNLSDVVLTTPSSGQYIHFNGSQWVNFTPPTPVSALDDLSDVITTTPANGEALVYNGTNWVNTAVSTVTDLDGLTDVVLTTPVSGQGLVYNGTTWINTAVSTITDLNGLTDVILTTPVNGQALVYNGTNWVNTLVSTVTDLDGLTDVVLTTPSSGQVLEFNGTNWINTTPSSGATTLDGLTDVDVTTTPPVLNDLLAYNGTTWVAAALTTIDGGRIPTAPNDEQPPNDTTFTFLGAGSYLPSLTFNFA